MVNSSVNRGEITLYRCLTGYKAKDVERSTKEFEIHCELDDSKLSASWSEASGCEGNTSDQINLFCSNNV